MKSPRFWVVLLLLLGAFTTLHLRASVDRVPPSEPLNLLPQTIDAWSSQDVPISQDTLDILGDGRFLNRIYTISTPTGRLVEPPVSLVHRILSNPAHRPIHSLSAELPARSRLDLCVLQKNLPAKP